MALNKPRKFFRGCEPIQIEAGQYYIGDPEFLLDDNDYMKLRSQMYDKSMSNGRFVIDEKVIIVYQTFVTHDTFIDNEGKALLYQWWTNMSYKS
jgi:hypothetical protein